MMAPCTAMISRQIDGISHLNMRECGAFHTGEYDHGKTRDHHRLLFTDSHFPYYFRTDKVAEFIMALSRVGNPIRDFNPYLAAHSIFD